jgi:hypothetical protein
MEGDEDIVDHLVRLVEEKAAEIQKNADEQKAA